MSNKRNSMVFSLIIAILLPIFMGIIVGVTTGSSISTWYPTLRKPTWNPPSWIFGPVWTVLYGLMGLASWLVWRKWATQAQQVRGALLWYGLQLGLNFLWSIIFFGVRRPDLALIEIIALWGAILITMIGCHPELGIIWSFIPIKTPFFRCGMYQSLCIPGTC